MNYPIFIMVLGASAALFAGPVFADDIRSQFPDVGGPNRMQGVGQFGQGAQQIPPGGAPAGFNPGAFGAGGFNAGGFNSAAFNRDNAPPADFNNGPSNTALLRRIYFDPRKMPKPDQFADYPTTDGSGARHFGNGRHYNLSTMSVRAAVSKLNADDEKIFQQAVQNQLRQQNQGRFPF